MATSREYHSDLRQQRAEETRARIRSSARRLFLRDGFTSTTVKDIANDAGVAPPTVYATFGSKSGIVLAMIEDLEAGADRSEWIERMIAEPDPRKQLRLFVAWTRTFLERGADTLRAILAAGHEPEVMAAAAQGDANRRRGTAELVSVLAEKGALRSGLDRADAAERLWLLTSVEQAFTAIDTLGWSFETYEHWLAELLDRELLSHDVATPDET